MSKIHGKLGIYGPILTVIGMAAALAGCGGSSGSDSASVAAASTSSPALITSPALIKNPTVSGTPTSPVAFTLWRVVGKNPGAEPVARLGAP